MFHLKYPRFRGFFTWDELGCMSRALGFSVDLFKSHLIEEIQDEDNGLPIKEVIKMLDYKLLYKALHLSQNLHTEDWNTCVFRSCISILNRKALTFEDIYQARIAYQAYEAGDMKGMLIDQHVLLRTLKMCGKTISPKKLIHRVKHNSVMYDEPGRIQLYEFLDLLLWANGYEPYVPEKSFEYFEMEDGMFKLHDFDTLLTHHDKKLANKLDNQFLNEEWAFTKTKYATKSKLTDPAVISANRRSDEVSTQKNEFRRLKNDVGNSQTIVYKAAQGCIRQRPVTAPNLAMYDTRRIQEEKRRESKAFQTALNDKVHKLIKRTEIKDNNNNKAQFDLSDKPAINGYKRGPTPAVVTMEEKEETDRQLESLWFQIETEEGRHEIAMDTEMDHYIPDYKETYLKNKTKVPSAPHIAQKVQVRRPSPQRYDMSKMSHPIPKISPCHALRCDARFRGWYAVRSKKGPHYVLMSPYFHDSSKGQLLRKLVKMSDTSIKKLHGDFIYRYTKRDQMDRRPVTAPAVMTADEYEVKRGRSKISRKSSATSGYNSMENYDGISFVGESFPADSNESRHPADVLDLTGCDKGGPDQSTHASNTNITEDSRSENDLNASRDTLVTIETSLSDKVKLMKLTGTTENNEESANKPRAKSAIKQELDVSSPDQEMYPRSVSAYGNRQCLDELVPMPYMDHSKPKTVSVGSIGKISLLESISEAKYWEDAMKGQQKEKAAKMANRKKNTQLENDETVDEGLDHPLPESSHVGDFDEGEVRKVEENGGSEFLSIILREEEMNSGNERPDSEFSDRMTPHGESVVDMKLDIPVVCESPTDVSAKLDDIYKDIDDSKGILPTGRVHRSKTGKQKTTKNVDKKIQRKSTEEQEKPVIIEDTYMTENEKYLRQLNDMLKINVEKDKESSRDKKHVVLKSYRSTSSRSSRSEAQRYERLVNRVKQDITPKLAQRILAGP